MVAPGFQQRMMVRQDQIRTIGGLIEAAAGTGNVGSAVKQTSNGDSRWNAERRIAVIEQQERALPGLLDGPPLGQFRRCPAFGQPGEFPG